MAYIKMKVDLGEAVAGQVYEVVRTVGNISVINAGSSQVAVDAKLCEPVNDPNASTFNSSTSSANDFGFSNLEDEEVTPPEPEPETEEERQAKLKEAAEAAAKKQKEWETQRDKYWKAGKIPLSFITGGQLPDSGVDHMIECFQLSDWGKDDLPFIQEIDQDHVWDANILEDLWIAWKENMRCLAVGDPGTGKSTSYKQFTAWLRQPYMEIPCEESMDTDTVFGRTHVNEVNGTSVTEWEDGLLPDAMQRGYFLNMDEWFKTPPGVGMAVQPLRDTKKGFLTLKEKKGTAQDKVIYPHERFRLFVTDNVKGQGDNMDKFSATQIQDTSSLDGFEMTVCFDYLMPDKEVSMLKRKYPKVKDEELIKRLVTLAGTIRTSYRQGEVALTLSPRGLGGILKIVSFFEDQSEYIVSKAIKRGFIDKLADDVEVQHVLQSMNNIGL